MDAIFCNVSRPIALSAKRNAEREGFEPSWRVSPPTAFPERLSGVQDRVPRGISYSRGRQGWADAQLDTAAQRVRSTAASSAPDRAVLDQEERNRHLYDLLTSKPTLAKVTEAEPMRQTYAERGTPERRRLIG